MKPDLIDIANFYEKFCELTEDLQEIWENSSTISSLSSPQRLIDAMSQLAGILRNIEESGDSPDSTNSDINTLGEYGLQLLSELSELAGTLQQKKSSRGLENLSLPMALWTARHGGEITNLAPIVNALAYFANHSSEPKFMVQLLSLSSEIYESINPKMAENEPKDPMNPWRLLVLNRAIIATRTFDPELMAPVFDSVVEHLPETAASFFEEGIEQMNNVEYPKPVKELMTQYFQTFNSKRILH